MYSYYNLLYIYFDGASRNNPRGPAGCGWVIYEDDYGNIGGEIARGQKYLGYNISNNQAEYEGVEAALQFMQDNDIGCDELCIRGDSEVVLKQLDGVYRVRSRNITEYYNAVVELLSNIEHNYILYEHVPRYENERADELANDAINEEESYVWD